MAIQELSKTEIDVAAGGAPVGAALAWVISTGGSIAGSVIKQIGNFLGGFIEGFIAF